jgi:hypothetical protein
MIVNQLDERDEPDSEPGHCCNSSHDLRHDLGAVVTATRWGGRPLVGMSLRWGGRPLVGMSFAGKHLRVLQALIMRLRRSLLGEVYETSSSFFFRPRFRKRYYRATASKIFVTPAIKAVVGNAAIFMTPAVRAVVGNAAF